MGLNRVVLSSGTTSVTVSTSSPASTGGGIAFDRETMPDLLRRYIISSNDMLRVRNFWSTQTSTPSLIGTSDQDVLSALFSAIRKGHLQVRVVKNGPPTTQADRSQMSLSPQGFTFLYNHEAQTGVSNRLYWPGGGSGVTLGPGYDLGSRLPSAVVTELTKIGVPSDIAQKVSLGAGLTGQSAKAFCDTDKNLVNLSYAQELQLLKDLVPNAEQAVRDGVKVTLTQYQFDALVSLAYNIGAAGFKGTGTTGANPVLDYVNQGQLAKAAGSFWVWRRSGGVTNSTLVKRRAEEALMFNHNMPVQNVPFGNVQSPS